MVLRETILDGTMQVFNRKGLKFTMDDVASELGMSKKTIYTVFRDKETLFLEMVDYCFDTIKESEKRVLEDESLDTVGKIRAILGVLPESYRDIDFRQLYLLKDKFPKIYKKVEERLETGWETTIRLIEEGIEEGEIIGYMGNTGYGDEGTRGKFPVHLHFGVYVRDKAGEKSINPYYLLKKLESR